MNRKILIYLCSFGTVIAAVCMYFISRENTEKAVITGEYDIWETDGSIVTETEANIITVSGTVGAEIYTSETFTEDLSESMAETDRTEFLYIDINSAGMEQLMLLDGIGEVTAEKIINYRIINGGFKNIEEIMNVNGIGKKTFFNIKDHIYVENPVYPADIDPYVPEQTYQDPVFNNEPVVQTAEPSQDNTQENLLSTENETRELLFNLNTVTREELLLIPDMDEKTADSIISLRTSIKYFSNTYELLYAEEMSEAKLKKIISYFYVDNNQIN